MKKILFLAFLIIIPIVLGQNYTLTTGQLPTNITLNLEINNLLTNDTIELGSDDWLTLEVNSFSLTENDTNYTFNPILSIPLIEEGNYTKKVYYNATGFSGFEINIEIEIINNTETYQNFLENEDRKYLDCVINKIRNSNEENNLTKRLRSEYECRYEVTNNPNGTIAIQKEIQIEEKPIIDSETKNKINTMETTTTGISTDIGLLKTDITTYKNDIINRLNEIESNLTTKQTEEKKTGINWEILIIITGIAILILGGLGFYMMKKRKEGLQPAERVSKGKPLPQKEEPKKKGKPEFDRLQS